MFVTEVGALPSRPSGSSSEPDGEPLGFGLQVALWLWFTVLFANFAEAMAEGRGKAQADALRKTRTQTMANRPSGRTDRSRPSPPNSCERTMSSSSRAGEIIPATAR